MVPTKPTAVPSLDQRQIERDLLALCGIGNRFVGTPGERAAQDMLEEEFIRAGLANVRREAVEVQAYTCTGTRCEVLPLGTNLPSVGLQLTANGTVEAEAIYIGRPKDVRDIERLDREDVGIDARIVIFESFYPYLIAPALEERGAVGLVVVSEISDGLIGHFCAQMYPPGEPPEFAGVPLSVPGVTVELEAGRRLIALLRDGTVRLRISHDAEYKPHVTANVVGELPADSGSSLSEEVVLGAHYDCQFEGVGACDNATGVSALLAIARAWRDAKLKRRVVFAAFADEEHGFAGSVSYCRRHSAKLARTIAMVNLDALGWAHPAKRALYADPSIHAFAVESARTLHWVPEEELEASSFPGSDYNSFIDAGVPACFFWRFPPRHPYYHTKGDTPELIDFGVVCETAAVAAYTAFRLASEPDIELGRARPSKRWLHFDSS